MWLASILKHVVGAFVVAVVALQLVQLVACIFMNHCKFVDITNMQNWDIGDHVLYLCEGSFLIPSWTLVTGLVVMKCLANTYINSSVFSKSILAI